MMKFQLMLMAALVAALAACAGNTATPAAEVATASPTAPAATLAPTATGPPPATATVPPNPTPPPPEPAAPESPEVAGNPNLDYAQVQFVRAVQTGANIWRFDVTVRHNDQGWDHYADLWRVVDRAGNVLGERVLLHPHDTEQPFTRSQSGIEIPPEIGQVRVEAACNVHGWGGQTVLVDLNATTGENFEVER